MAAGTFPSELRVSTDASGLAQEAAARVVQAARDAVSQRGRFRMALAGGSTPEITYSLLAARGPGEGLDWLSSLLFFGDERFVPHTDPRSNYHMVQRAWLGPAQVPAERVFAIPTDTDSPAVSASQYAKTLAKQFGTKGDELPRFDLILLGLGDDGHTASLFPGKPALHETTAWVTASPPGVLPPPVDRVTLTFPLLNAARQVMFLVAGASKARPLHDVLKGHATPETRPAAGVRPTDGKLVWLVDEAAAAGLDSPKT